MELSLPMPPSANGLFGNKAVGGRFKTRAYLDWISEAGWLLQKQRPGRIAGPYEMEVAIPRSKGRRVADLGNREKALSDLLVRHGVVDDDSRAQKITMTWTDGAEARVVLTRAR